MKKRDYTFAIRPGGGLYRLLLSAAVGPCARALLVVRPDLGLASAGADLLERLEVHLLDAGPRSSWPGTVLVQGSATVHEFWFGDAVAAALDIPPRDLFQWRQPELPEDLCLLRSDGSPWLTTVARELDARLRLTDAEFAAMDRQWPDVAAILQPVAAR